MFETNDEEYDRLENQFLDTLNGTDREIYLMRKQGLTQAEIAERLGYKTHSAVTKRMKKMRKALVDFILFLPFGVKNPKGFFVVRRNLKFFSEDRNISFVSCRGIYRGHCNAVFPPDTGDN